MWRVGSARDSVIGAVYAETMPDPSIVFTEAAQVLVAGARHAVLSTIDARDGRPRSVPICHVLAVPEDGGPPALWSPLDEKPKAAADPRRLRRVTNLAADPRATILVDRWDEDWPRLAFVELGCLGAIVEPGGEGHAAAVDALRAKYPQYRRHRLEERPMLRFTVTAVRSWAAE